jgi:hypothetical protein
MTYRDDFVTISLNDSTITGLIDERLHPDSIPAEPVYPLVIYHAFVSDSNVHSRTHDGAGRTVTRTQLDIYAERSRTAEEIADAFAARWNGKSYPAYGIGYAFKGNRISDGWQQDNDTYRVILDLLIEHSEP